MPTLYPEPKLSRILATCRWKTSTAGCTLTLITEKSLYLRRMLKRIRGGSRRRVEAAAVAVAVMVMVSRMRRRAMKSKKGVSSKDQMAQKLRAQRGRTREARVRMPAIRVHAAVMMVMIIMGRQCLHGAQMMPDMTNWKGPATEATPSGLTHSSA
jgi:hypothetical protein